MNYGTKKSLSDKWLPDVCQAILMHIIVLRPVLFRYILGTMYFAQYRNTVVLGISWDLAIDHQKT